jgi:predicted MFS family arabinose efflux permease
VGALIGSITVSLLGPTLRAGRTMLIASMAWYLFLLAFAFSTHPMLAMALLVCAGLAQSLSMLPLSLILLRTSDVRFRGRIMGVRMMAIYPLPLGLLLTGALIPRIGYQWTAVSLVITGLLLTLMLALTWRRDLIDPDAVSNSR